MIRGVDLRFGVLGSVFGVSVECFLHMVCFEPLEESEETGDHTDGTHYVVHVSCVDDDIGPVIAVFLLLS
jgi:hypothetical protein